MNSTSVEAWTAFLRANRDLAVDYAQGGGSNTGSGSPFPSSSAPSAPGGGANTYWSGFSRLTDAQVDALAVEIVTQVRMRGPFMSLSDFVNRQMGSNTALRAAGALQTAIDNVGATTSMLTDAGGVNSEYGNLRPIVQDTLIPNGNTAAGIPMDITQADILRPLAPRLTARADTFRIRAYGEVRGSDDNTVVSRATCEAVVQRVPEYVDPNVNPETGIAENEPWAEGADLNAINKQFGRRFKVVQFRWLRSDEI